MADRKRRDQLKSMGGFVDRRVPKFAGPALAHGSTMSRSWPAKSGRVPGLKGRSSRTKPSLEERIFSRLSRLSSQQ